MFKRNVFKKFVSILTAALILLSAMPSFADGASGVTQFFYTDFSDLDASVFNFDKSNESIVTGTAGIDVKIREHHPNYSEGTKTYATIGSDTVYGSTLVLTSEKGATKNLCVDINENIDSSKTTIIKTAVKKSSSIDEADVRIWARGINSANSSSDDFGIRFVNFNRDGKLYVNDDQVDKTQKQTVGTYELDTWYEITIEYSAVNKFSKVTINGGCYENMVFYNTNMNGNQLQRIQLGFANRNAATTSDVKMHIGYIDVTEDTDNATRSYAGMQLDDRYSFDRLPVGAAVTDGQLGYVGLEVNKSDYRNNTFPQVVDADHGVSLVTDHTDFVENSSYLVELRYIFDKAPHRRAYSDGSIAVEYDVKMDQGMKVGLNSVFEADGTLSGNNIGNRDWIKVGSEYGGLTVEAGKWYKYMRIIDYVNDRVRTVFYDPANPTQYYELEYGDPSTSGEVVRLVLKSDRDATVASNSSTVAYDNLHVYTAADFAFDAAYPASGSTLAKMSDAVALSYNAPVKSAQVVVTNHGEVVNASAYTVAYAGKSIVIKPKTSFDTNGEYSVTVSGVTDIFGTTLSSSQTLNFITEDEKYTSSYKILNAEDDDAQIDPAQIKAGDKIKVSFNISGNVNFPLIHAVGVFDSNSNELKNILFYSENANTSHSFITHQNHVMTLEAGTYIRILAWNRDTYAPLVDSVTLNVVSQ